MKQRNGDRKREIESLHYQRVIYVRDYTQLVITKITTVHMNRVLINKQTKGFLPHIMDYMTTA